MLRDFADDVANARFTLRCNLTPDAMQDFRKLDVWTKSHELALDVHRTVSKVRKLESGTRAQLNRSAQSIPANIAEGCGRSSAAELARYADQAIGSTTELEYHLLLTKDLGILPEPDFERLTANAVQIRRMLFGLRKAVKNRGRVPENPVSEQQ